MPKDKHPKYRPDMGEQLKAILAKQKVSHCPGCGAPAPIGFWCTCLKEEKTR